MAERWDEFLTERDRALLTATGRDKRRPRPFGDRPALLIVDDYYGAVGAEREPILKSVQSWPMSCGLEGWEAIDRTTELLVEARAAEVPVIYFRELEGFPSPWGRRRDPEHRDERSSEVQTFANRIVAEVAPVQGDLVIEKTAPSAFYGTPLLFHLNYLHIDTLLVCGEVTSGCVRATVVDGATHRYAMGVVKDCCFDRIEASHWINLFDMHQKYAEVVDLDAAKAYLKLVAR